MSSFVGDKAFMSLKKKMVMPKFGGITLKPQLKLTCME